MIHCLNLLRDVKKKNLGANLEKFQFLTFYKGSMLNIKDKKLKITRLRYS